MVSELTSEIPCDLRLNDIITQNSTASESPTIKLNYESESITKTTN
jgi:hypothetical protein